ncbi:MAG: ATP-dependent DNA helicase [Victivallales bacterium]|nr:ATP-dependent DNA helicase [Victivallales bacterium]
MPIDFDIDDFNVEYAPLIEEEELDIIPECEMFFAPDGPLKATAEYGGQTYEFRPQQLNMATSIAAALQKGENLCIEAPTGVGKSFAYLIPLIYRSRHAGRPALISTETIHLQEQLIDRDLPLLKKITKLEFKTALAKGRHNYLCRRRFSLLSGEQRDALLPAPALALDLDRLGRWMEKTTDGERDSIDFRLEPDTWSLACCDGVSCLGPKCEFYRNCFYYRARQTWESADIIVANHALFFTDLEMRIIGGAAGALLPNYGVVLLDEAHTLEDNAADHLGLHLSRLGIVSTLNRLYNHDGARGLLMRKGVDPILRGAVSECRDEAYGFFAPYENLLHEHNENALEIHDPGRFPNRLGAKLEELHRKLATYLEEQEEVNFRTEMEAQLTRCREFIGGIDQFTRKLVPDAVYYAESERGGTTLHATPLNVADLLSKILFGQDFPVILCSATLTVKNSFDYYLGRTGFCNGKTLLLDSPFDRNQAKVYIPRHMPEPKDDDFQDALEREIPRFVEFTQGKAFVLFTSYASMRRTADDLREYFREKKWQLLIQGENMTRTGLLREFREDVDSVLFGTDSFWTGVDVPGESLSNVIVTKLPFAVPSHPLIAARMAKLELSGLNSFANYSLPEAVLKFRQGVGRLIRSRSDRGIVVILDRRIVSKRYGKLFLDSIPYNYEIV